MGKKLYGSKVLVRKNEPIYVVFLENPGKFSEDYSCGHVRMSTAGDKSSGVPEVIDFFHRQIF